MSKHSKGAGFRAEDESKKEKVADDGEKAGIDETTPTERACTETKPEEAEIQKDNELETLKRENAEMKSRINTLSEESASLKDQYLRKIADYENFRKRMFREKDEAILFANQNLLVDMVTVVDDMDRVIEASEKTKNFSALLDGLNLTRKKFLGLLESKYALKQFDAKGKPFDHHIHEAVMVEYRDALSEPLVVEEFMKGYQLNNRVIRTSKTKVAMPKPPETATENPTEKTPDAETGDK